MQRGAESGDGLTKREREPRRVALENVSRFVGTVFDLAPDAFARFRTRLLVGQYADGRGERLGNEDASGFRVHEIHDRPFAHGLRNLHLYEGDEEWINIQDAVGDLTKRFLCLNEVYPDGFMIPKRFIGENIIHLPTVKTHVFTTTTGAMKNAFGGLLNERRHWTHPVIHETLVDLLMIQKKIHRGVFAVMDGTFAGDGPGPRCMIPHVKNVMLASSDQVAIDAVAAKLMGFDPMSIKFIRMAHDLGLGCGDPRDIEIVGDPEAGAENWKFVGPFKKMTFAARMQHKIYWGPFKKPIEWSLKTVLAPWAYMASVVYHDSFWYPVLAKKKMHDVMGSVWGRLFRHWERVTPDARGYAVIPEEGAEIQRTGLRALWRSMGILLLCIKEAPEFASRRRHQRAQS